MDIVDYTIVEPSDANSVDGSVEVFVNGGVAPYSYTWSNGSNDSAITNITGGWYTVTVTDSAPIANLQTTIGWYWVPTSPARGRGKMNFMQAYPNPCKHKSVINFVTLTDGWTQVAVFSMNGQEVARPFEGFVEKNQMYSATFNANQMSEGLYLCKLTTANDEVVFQKLCIGK